MVESKGLVPEGYVRFLNDEEERQYLAQSPPTNTLLPRPSSGEETPTQPPKGQWETDVAGDDDDEWIDEPDGINKSVKWGEEDVSERVEVSEGVEEVTVEKA